MGLVKICGVCSVTDVALAERAGADEIGLNFVPGRARAISLDQARALRAATRLPLVAIVADADDELVCALAALGLDAWQLHGNETPARAAELLARGHRVYKAVAVRSAADVCGAAAYPGARVLFDAATGGSGVRFDWTWLAAAGPRPYFVAGGLDPDNVSEAIACSDAAGVDVASGVEAKSGVKDPAKLAAFVAMARQAFTARR